MMLLAAFASRPEAQIAQARLQAEGIAAFMPDFNVLTADFDPSFMSGWRILVPEEQLARALAVLREAQEGDL